VTVETRPGPVRRRAGIPPRLLGLLGLAGFAVLIEVLPRIGVLPAEYFPSTSTILGALVDYAGDGQFWTAFGLTLRTWATGLVIAVAAGVVVGVVIGSVPVLRALTASTIEFLRPIPSVALIPLVTVLLGTGMSSTLVLVVYAAFWQVLVQVLYGVADVDPVARETAHSYRLNFLYRVRYLVWPTTLPYAVTGLRLATAVALILTITGELAIGTPGLGKLMDTAYNSGPDGVPSVYAIVVVTVLIGVAANYATRSAERLVLAWHPSVRAELPA
jgi:ABC-type nitrate/sulfonate/bicarbonate transport system permease component